MNAKQQKLTRLLLAALGLLVVQASHSIADDTTYVASSKSDKYHYAGCQSAKRISPANLITFDSVEEAQKAGYVPCKTCSPPSATSSSSSTSIKKTQASSDGRCIATTKKGTRCKRKAQAGSNYCWQHK